jgi:hypothetical protein
MPAIDLLGYSAALAVLAAFCMSSIVPLRIVAVLSNVLFASYGLLAHLYPVFLLHAILLPVNLWKLAGLTYCFGINVQSLTAHFCLRDSFRIKEHLMPTSRDLERPIIDRYPSKKRRLHEPKVSHIQMDSGRPAYTLHVDARTSHFLWMHLAPSLRSYGEHQTVACYAERTSVPLN